MYINIMMFLHIAIVMKTVRVLCEVKQEHIRNELGVFKVVLLWVAYVIPFGFFLHIIW